MGVLSWIHSLFRRRSRSRVGVAAPSSATTPATGVIGATRSEAKPQPFPAAITHLPHPDRVGVESIPEREAAWLDGIERRVLAGDFDLPQLPSTTLAVVQLAADPDAAAARLSALVERDPVLSSELLKTANSVLFSGAAPAQTLQQAVVRLGARQLRGLAFALQMKRVVSRAKGLTAYADSFWRQATSMAKLAREVAAAAQMDEDEAFLVGLLHDIGKVPLLDLIGREVNQRSDVSRALVGRVFAKFHETVGARLAQRWSLPAHLAQVAARHHDFASNTDAPRWAALASLVHGLDLQLALGSEPSFYELRQRPEFDVLGIDPAVRGSLLRACVAAFAAAQDESKAFASPTT